MRTFSSYAQRRPWSEMATRHTVSHTRAANSRHVQHAFEARYAHEPALYELLRLTPLNPSTTLAIQEALSSFPLCWQIASSPCAAIRGMCPAYHHRWSHLAGSHPTVMHLSGIPEVPAMPLSKESRKSWEYRAKPAYIINGVRRRSSE